MITELRKLSTSELYKFPGSVVQGLVMGVASLLSDLEEGRQLRFATNSSPFMVSVRVGLAFFMRYTTVDDELVEADALKACCEALFDPRKTKPVEFSDLENPIKFSW